MNSDIVDKCREIFKVFPTECFEFAQIDPSTPSDWSATYFQFSVEHALRYATDKKPENKNQVICLASLSILNEKLPIHIIRDELYGSLTLSGAEKAQIIKKHLNISTEAKLMKTINGILILYDNADDMEFIVSHEALIQENFEIKTIAQFKINNHQLSHWRIFNQNNQDTEWIKLSPLETLQPHLLSKLIFELILNKNNFND